MAYSLQKHVLLASFVAPIPPFCIIVGFFWGQSLYTIEHSLMVLSVKEIHPSPIQVPSL